MKKLKRLFITLVAVLMVLTYAPTKVSADTVVAKIGNNEYESLKAAVVLISYARPTRKKKNGIGRAKKHDSTF